MKTIKKSLESPTLSSKEPRIGDNLAVEWGEAIDQERDLEWEDYCKGSHCDSDGIDKF